MIEPEFWMKTRHHDRTEQFDETNKSLWETADAYRQRDYLSRVERWFVNELADQLSIPEPWRLVEIFNDDQPLRLLLVAQDETRIFIGEDDTAYQSNGLFGFPVPIDGDLPPVRTCEEAIDLITPTAVVEAEVEGEDVKRQGEWFLIPTEREPGGSIHKCGVAERPFGLSPLINHVPREWAISGGDDVFFEILKSRAPEVARHCDTVEDAIDNLMKGMRIRGIDGVDLENDIPTPNEFTKQGELLVRGTLRHRENDHYMTKLGEQWHRAVTHGIDVYTFETEELRDGHAIMRMD